MTRRLLVDECVNRLVVLPPFLSLAECVFVADLAASAADESVMALARREKLILLTEDSDFGRLIFAERLPPPPGVVLVTMPNREPAERASLIGRHAEHALAEADGALVVIDGDQRRRRAFPSE